MSGILIMGVITFIAAALLWGGLLYTLTRKQTRYLLFLLPGLPLSAAVNLLVKGPLAHWVANITGVEPAFRLTSPAWFLVFAWLLAPVTEETIKILPLLIPAVRRAAWAKGGALWTGLALGMSFGLGEAAYLAYSFSRASQYAWQPWYYFGGFFSERLAVVFVHGVLTALTVTGLVRGWKFGLLGWLAAVGLHGLVNLGAVLLNLNLLSPAGTQILFLVTLLLLLLLFQRMRRSTPAQVPAQAEEVVFERENQL